MANQGASRETVPLDLLFHDIVRELARNEQGEVHPNLADVSQHPPDISPP